MLVDEESGVLIDEFSVKVCVRLEPGIYIADDNASATGKTRLCKLLKEYREYGLAVDGYTYYDYKNGNKIPQDVKLLMIDRYDMYRDELVEDITKLSKSAIVLIDSKYFPAKLKDYDYCSIFMRKDNYIEVL